MMFSTQALPRINEFPFVAAFLGGVTMLTAFTEGLKHREFYLRHTQPP